MDGSRTLNALVWAGAAIVAGCLCASAAETNKWDVSLNAGLSLTRGNKDNTLFNSSATGFRAFGRNEIRLGAEGAYGKTGSDQTVGNAKVSANYKRLVDHSYGYFDASVLEDTIADIDYRAVVGPGVGHYLVDNSRVKLGAEVGVSYIFQRIAGNEDDFAACRLAERLDVKLSDTAKCWETVEYLPAFRNFAQYLINAEAGIEAAINAHLSLRVVAQDMYNSNPGAGKKHDDLTLTAGFGYRL